MQVTMFAAGLSAGEADQLRRAMAAWKRKGGLERYYDRIVVNGTQELIQFLSASALQI